MNNELELKIQLLQKEIELLKLQINQYSVRQFNEQAQIRDMRNDLMKMGLGSCSYCGRYNCNGFHQDSL